MYTQEDTWDVLSVRAWGREFDLEFSKKGAQGCGLVSVKNGRRGRVFRAARLARYLQTVSPKPRRQTLNPKPLQ